MNNAKSNTTELSKIKQEYDGDEDIQKLIIKIEIILLSLSLSSKLKLEEYKSQAQSYNTNSERYQDTISTIGEIKGLYREDDENFQALIETFTQRQSVSKIEDEEKRNSQMKSVDKRLEDILKIKMKLFQELQKLMEDLKKNKNKNNGENLSFYIIYLQSLQFIKCIEINIITLMIGKKFNSASPECDKREIKSDFDIFKVNSRKQTLRKRSSLENSINQLKKQKDESSSNLSILTQQVKELNKEIEELSGKIENLGKDKNTKTAEKSSINTTITSTTRSGASANPANLEKQRILGEQLANIEKELTAKNQALENKRGDLKTKNLQITEINTKSTEFDKVISSKEKELKSFSETSGALFNSMGALYPDIYRIFNTFDMMQKKKDEMDKKKSNNRLLQSMQNDMLYKEVNALLSVESLGGSRYKLKIGRSAKDFKKRISVLKKYFDGKNKFYENRNSILSALTFNINSVVSAFTNETPKNLSFNNKNFADIFTSNKSAPSVQPVYNPQSYAQPAFGSPAPMAYAPQQPALPQQPVSPMGYMGRGGASEMNAKKPEQKSIASYEFITILDKVFEDLTSKVRSNEVYENRLKVFLKFLDQRDRELNEEILAKLNRVEKINKPEYEFLFPAQIRFITRRVLRIKEFMNTPRNNSEMKHVYMTDFILMYFSLHYILSNFLDLILKPQAFNEMNS